jgi:hypothetical protein
MEQERWRRVKEIFGAAVHAPPETQPHLIDSMCADDAELRAEVLSLLRASSAADAAAWEGPRRRRAAAPEAPFEPDARFTLDARLGSGGFGVVYRAFDRKLERWVALKTLRQHAPDALARFKHEFRALADLSHPNLLRLFELFVGEREVYFSMELVEGVPLSGRALQAEADAAARWRRAAGLFADLADGVRALHAQGVLHRDLKPSNVLVTADDRVVVLDFGLVTDVPDPQAHRNVSQVMGTPAYMAPERLAGRAEHEASDWYSVGVILREALEAEGAGPAPPGLAALALELTAEDPSARPRGAEIIGRLRRLAGARRAEVSTPPTDAAAPARAPFVGRRAPLAALDRAYARACAGQLAIARVRGPSGIGKTALVRHFLERLRGDARRPLVLRARCHEREALGFKALDGIVDGLAQHLRRLPVHEAEALLPGGVLELARLFPVLLQAPAVASARRRLSGAADSIELRRRAFDALRELFGRILHVTPVVLFIDDLQWGDLDSAALLRHLVRGADAPPLLVIACWREQDGAARGGGPLLEALAAGVDLDVDVEALAPDEVRGWARDELSGRADAEGLVEAIVREAAGVPIFAQELVREAKRAPATLFQGGAVVQLDAVLAARVERLPAQQRALLETVALAAKPLDRAAARRAAALEGPLAHDAEQALLAAKLLRPGDGGEVLETYHDRIRELVTRLVPPTRAARLHDGLVQALLAGGGAEPEDLAYHLRAAGRLDEAADAAARAARRAAEALAFDRAAALYSMALDLRAVDHPEAGALAVGLADALAFAGRGAEAADAYLRAASKLPEQHLSLSCKAAEQLLQSGDVGRGKALVKDLLATLGWSVPERPAALLASVVLRRAELALRGLRFKLRREAEVPQRRLVRLDASWALVSGLSLIDTVHASYFQNHHLLQALAVGEPRRLLRALTGEAAYCSMPGTKGSRRRADAVLATLRRIAAQHPGEPIGEPMVAIGTSMTAWMYGDWRTSQREAAVAARAFRERCTGVTWELGTARTFMMGTLTYMGDYVEYERHWPGFLEDARARGDVFAETKLILIDLSHAASLAKDDADGASAAVAGALGKWHAEGFHLQHFWALHARVEIALYRGDPATAWTLLQDARRGLRRSLLLRVQSLRLWLRQTRARAALALAAHDPTASERLLAIARAEARAIARERTPWGAGMASLIGGLLLEREGDAERAAAKLDDAATRLDAAHMVVYAAAARRARGRVAGPESGAPAVRDAEALMRVRGVHDPARFAALLAPGPR